MHGVNVREMDTHDLKGLVFAANQELRRRAAGGAGNNGVTVESFDLLPPGTRVVTRDTLKPKYMCGRAGVVVKMNTATCDVKLDDVTGINPSYLATNGTVRVPMPALRKEV